MKVTMYASYRQAEAVVRKKRAKAAFKMRIGAAVWQLSERIECMESLDSLDEFQEGALSATQSIRDALLMTMNGQDFKAI